MTKPSRSIRRTPGPRLARRHIAQEGTLHKDERLVRRGYNMLLDAIDAWPEFNHFSVGFVVSRLPADSPRFKEGLEWQWHELDVCAQTRIDRTNPDYSTYMALETREGPKRACWNSWIALHNFEGFLLNMGDMLVKSGDWHTGQKIYANSRGITRAGSSAGVLEARIADAPGNVAAFNEAQGAPVRPIMINSTFACTVCHQQ